MQCAQAKIPIEAPNSLFPKPDGVKGPPVRIEDRKGGGGGKNRP